MTRKVIEQLRTQGAADVPILVGGLTPEQNHAALKAVGVAAAKQWKRDVGDPWAGSYFMEALTDDTGAAAQAELDKIEAMVGAVAAIESEYMQRVGVDPERLRPTSPRNACAASSPRASKIAISARSCAKVSSSPSSRRISSKRLSRKPF